MITTGGQAFPGFDQKGQDFFKGMTIRQWYTGKALEGLASGILTFEGAKTVDNMSKEQGVPISEVISGMAVALADATIKKEKAE